jgi:phosphoglycerate dehydrogenase-like enzyme
MTRASRRPRISVIGGEDVYRIAVLDGGGDIVDPGPATEGLVWGIHGDALDLVQVVRSAPNLRWVQLPSAGADGFIASGVVTPGYLWTSAKGAYSRPVAEHALALTLALLRELHIRARARDWAPQAGTSLFGLTIVVLGGGGIAAEFARLAEPFEVDLQVCRPSRSPVPFASSTFPPADLLAHLPHADVVLLAAPLTVSTRGIMDRTAFDAMKRTAILVNIARGGLVVTADLVSALDRGSIAGAALDVTDPEPLPPGHPLWDQPTALITPHSADTPEMIVPLLAARISENVRRFAVGDQLLGLIDVPRGY